VFKLLLAEVSTAERHLECEAVYDIELFPESNLNEICIYSCSAFAVLLEHEATILKGEHLAVILHEPGEDLLLPGGIPGTAIDKGVLLPGVAVEIAVEHEVPLLLHPLDELLGVVDGGVALLAGVDPLPIQVHAGQVAPVVAVDHPVDIQHGHNLDDEVLPQGSGDGRVRHQIVDDVLDEVAGHGLARVHPGRQENALLLLPIGEVPDNHIVAVVARDGLAQSLPLHPVPQGGVGLQRPQVPLQLRVRVRVAVGDVDRVIVVGEF
jgi:hypothetical protein